jgi:hypothetical protein
MKPDYRITGDAKPYTPKSVLSRDFAYVNAANTNVAETFKRVREEMDRKPLIVVDAK